MSRRLSPSRPGPRPGLLALLCALIAFLAFATSLPNRFAYDDRDIVVTNPRVIDPARAGEIWTSSYWPQKGGGGLFRPLTVWTYAVEHRLHDLKPFGFHLVNVLLNAAVSALVFLAALEYLGAWGALLAGLLFAVHPVHTEAVANVVGRAELLSALGFLVAWLAWPGAGSAGAPGRLWLRRALVALGYLFSLLSKETAILLPAGLLARDLLARRRPDWLALGLLAVVGAIYFGWRYQVLGSFTNPPGMKIYRIDNVIAVLAFPATLWTALSVIGRYLVLLVFPLRLAADYSYPQVDAAGPASAWAWLGLLVVGGAVAWLLREAVRWVRGRLASDRAVTIGALIFGVTLLPVSNLVFPIGTVMAERLLYLPSVGFVLVAAGLLARAAARRGAARPVAVVAGLLVFLGAARSLARSRDWKDDATLHATTIAVSPRSARARFNYGVTQADAGKLDAAIDELTTAVRLDPSYSEAWTNLGGYKIRLKRLDEARGDLLKAVETDSTWFTAWTNLGVIELQEGRPRQALEYLSRALKHQAEDPDIWFNMALARAALGDTAGTIEAYRRAVSLGSADADAYNNLAWYLAVSGGSLEEALRNAERAVALAPGSGEYYDTLGEVHLRAGRTGEARSAWTRALELGVASPEPLRERLKALGG